MKSPKLTTVLSGRGFGAEADGSGRAAVPAYAASRRWLFSS